MASSPAIVVCTVCHMYSLFLSVGYKGFTCDKCREVLWLTEKILELETCIVHYLPGARAPDILANLKVLANTKRKFSKIVIHVGANDVQLRQLKITQNNVKEVCELANTMSDTVICSGSLPAYRGDEIHSRV